MKPQLPDLELIESTHQFPTMFVFKAIGDHHGNFVSDVLNQVLMAFPTERKLRHDVKMSAKGNHSSVTVHVHCENAQEVHDVYNSLLKVNGLRALF